MVGTPYKQVARSCSIAASVAAGLNDSAGAIIAAP